MNAAPAGVTVDEAGLRPQYVLPGQVFATAEPTRFTTILGSCVAVCLYDAGRGIGGLNHYLLPGAPINPAEREPLRWGDPSIERLLELTLAAGARRACLQAKVFGGAQISARSVPDAMRIGERNIETALAALSRFQIPIMNQSLGGAAGRKIIFDSHTGMVWSKTLGRSEAISGAPPPSG
ncbi:MAG: CheD [Moraxellaceae bacterium]|jgi:chemotaxis protein CheD|nr:CheD [Moraxellaceae bacterium]